MWMMMLVVLMGPDSRPVFDPCEPVHQRYRQTLRQASESQWNQRAHALQYLRNMEGTIKDCFASNDGKGLIQKRKDLEARTIPPQPTSSPSLQPEHRKVDPPPADPPRKEELLPSVGAGKWYPHSASAALFSLVIPGSGQALQGRPGAAWLFFLGAASVYIAANVMFAVSAAEWAELKARNKTNETRVVGGDTMIAYVVMMVIGGAIHIGSVIDAAVWKPTPQVQ